MGIPVFTSNPLSSVIPSSFLVPVISVKKYIEWSWSPRRNPTYTYIIKVDYYFTTIRSSLNTEPPNLLWVKYYPSNPAYHQITWYQFVNQRWFRVIIRFLTESFSLVNRHLLPSRNEIIGFPSTTLSRYPRPVYEVNHRKRRRLWSPWWLKRLSVPSSPSRVTSRRTSITSRNKTRTRVNITRRKVQWIISQVSLCGFTLIQQRF